MTANFDASTASLPRAPAGTRLVRLRFRTCPGSDLVLELVRDNPVTTIRAADTQRTREHGGDRPPIFDPPPADVDAHGVAPDSWWTVRCAKLPDRYLRLMRGAHSLRELLRRYGFQDASGCVNHRHAIAYFSRDFESRELPHVPPRLRDATGVPQFYVQSGVCWYNAMCWTSTANRTILRMLRDHAPDDGLRRLWDRCIFDPAVAETLRSRLWREYAVGDDIMDHPSRDGRNGLSEFCVLCAQLKIPMIRFRDEDGHLRPMDPRVTDRRGRQHRIPKVVDQDRDHILVVRFQDGDHKRFPVLRGLKHGRKRYALVGLYMGQRFCGHQIAMCSPSEDWREWTIADADMHKDGIGPIHVYFDGDHWIKNWWSAWRELVHITKFAGGSKFCLLSPHNLDNKALDKFISPDSTTRTGPANEATNSIDLLYVPVSA